MPTVTIPAAEREYLSVEECAVVLGRGVESIRRAIRDGRLRAHKPTGNGTLAGRYIITRAALHEYATGEAPREQ